VAGLVRNGDRAVVFRGTVTTYDAFDPFTWPSAVVAAPRLVTAATRFIRLVNDALDIRIETKGERVLLRLENCVPLSRAAADFEMGALRQTSNVRPNRVFTADQHIILRRVGHLRKEKINEITEKAIEILSQ
jgi:hypothetical protein